MMIALMTDFGLVDPYVGIMKAVITSIAPEAKIIDITHDIPPHNIAAGAWVLAQSFDYLALNAIVVAVVDPGVGTKRLPIAVQIGSRVCIVPNNGLITRIVPADHPVRIISLDNERFWLNPPSHSMISATFHGRDIFAPVAAHFAHGARFIDLGTAMPSSALVHLQLPQPHCVDAIWHAHVIAIDHFGNVITDITEPLVNQFAQNLNLVSFFKEQPIAPFFTTFGLGPIDRPFWYIDSSRHAAIAIRNGNAAATVQCAIGDEILIHENAAS